MTFNDLLQSLVREGTHILKDIDFRNKKNELKQITGYSYELPLTIVSAGWDAEEPEDEDRWFPYLVVQPAEIDYDEEMAKAKIWILLGCYDSSEKMDGWVNITNAVERLAMRFRTNPVLEDYYYCERKMKVAYPERGSYPYFFAGIEMTWHLPVLEPNL